MAFSSICCSHIGFLSNISFTIPFQWNVLSTISLSKIFSWEVGEGPLYWYVVESTPISNVFCADGNCPSFACVQINTSGKCGLDKCSLPNTENKNATCVYSTSKEDYSWKVTIDNVTGIWTLEIAITESLAAIYSGNGGPAKANAAASLNLILNNHLCSHLPSTAEVKLFSDGGYIQIDTVMATSVAHLCERLRDQQYNRKIKSIKKWSKPALACDAKRDEQAGIDHCCNKLVEVNICACECAGFMKNTLSSCSITSIANNSLVWYTEYMNLSSPLVTVGDSVIRGQKLGYIVKPAGLAPHLHWGVGDGQPGGNIGQTIDIDDVFNWPASGERAIVSPPSPSIFSSDELCYIKSTLTSPVNQDCCVWEQLFDSSSHSDYEYYAQDLNCTSPDEDLGMPVFLASGGCDVTSVVTTVQDLGGSWIVIVKHTKGSSEDDSMSFAFGMAPREIQTCGIIENKIKQVVSEGFSARPIEMLQPMMKPLKVRGYNRALPVTLKLSHNLKQLSTCKKIASKVPERIALHYNAVTKAWQYSQHFLIDGVQWSVMFTLANPDESWVLQTTIGKTSGGKNSLSKVRIGLQQVPIDGFLINMTYDSGTVSSNCVVHYKSVSDELKLFGSEPLILRIGDK